MKKLIIFLILLIFITGCSVDYSIDIDNNFKETISVTPESSSELNNLRNNNYNNPAFYMPNYFEEEMDVLPDIERYNITFNNNVFYADYTFMDKYENSNAVNSSVGWFAVRNDYKSHIYAKDFTKVFNIYPTLNKITINIKTNKTVIGNNADSINGNVYTWIIYRNNPKRDVRFYYIDENYENNSNNNNNNNKPNNNDKQNNNGQKNNDKSDENNENISSNNKINKVLLYILYTLFFGLIFVIIIFRDKFKK